MNQSLLTGFMAHGLIQMQKLRGQYETRKPEILRRWQETVPMPRKKKKQQRKEIMLDYRINEYLGNLTNFAATDDD